MRSRSTSIRKTLRVPAPLGAAVLALLVATGGAQAFTILPDPSGDTAPTLAQDGYDLYLSISINGVPRDVVLAVHQEADGSLSMAPDDLKKAGLIAPVPLAPLADGKIALR